MSPGARSVLLKMLATVVGLIALLLSPPAQHQLAVIETQAARQAIGQGDATAAQNLVSGAEARARRYGWPDVRCNALEVRAMLALQQRRPAEAHACYKEILDDPPFSGPHLAGTWYALAMTSLQMGDSREAVEDFEKGLAIAERSRAPVDADTLQGYAAALASAGRTADAEKQRARAAVEAARERDDE